MSPAVRVSIVLLAAVLAAVSTLDYRAWRRQRARLLELLTLGGTGERAPGVAHDVKREPDPVRAALRTARGLLADELDRGWQAGLGPQALAAAHETGLVKLARARDISADALARRPSSWQAAEVLGATRYLDALRRRLAMTRERREAWRRPLLAARSLGPGQAEPVRFLAAATLSEWTRLSPAERQRAHELLRDAFADAATFDLLAASWLRIAPSRDTAFSVVPAEPRAWDKVGRFYAERADWGAFALAHERQRDALFDRLGERLRLAEKRLRTGDPRRARWYTLEVIESAPASRRFAPLLARALDVLPPGPLGEVRARRMAVWLAWSRDLCLLGDCPFDPPLLTRMAGLARLEDPAVIAAAAEMAGDWRTAELSARAAEDLTRDWAPYHLLKARRLAAGGDLDAARRSLERVHAAWRSRAAFLEVEALSSADEGRDFSFPPRRQGWPAEAWLVHHRPTLELSSAVPCQGLEVELVGVTPRGSAVEVSWDGDLAGTHAVAAGQPLRLALSVEPTTVHRLEIDPFVHPQIRPGPVRVRDCDS